MRKLHGLHDGYYASWIRHGIVVNLNLFSNNSTSYRHSDPHVIVRDVTGHLSLYCMSRNENRATDRSPTAYSEDVIRVNAHRLLVTHLNAIDKFDCGGESQ
jgi:hypothetical protein